MPIWKRIERGVRNFYFSNRIIAVVLSFLVICFIGIAGTLWWLKSGGVFATSKFNRAVWFSPLTNKSDSTCYRGGMAKDIKENLLQKGMSKGEVIKLLGNPDWLSSSEFHYVLGICRGIDYDNLQVYFDKNGEVINTAIVQN